MAGSGLKTLCEELGVLEAVGDREMGLKNRDLDDGTWGSGNWFPPKKMKKTRFTILFFSGHKFTCYIYSVLVSSLYFIYTKVLSKIIKNEYYF